MSSCETSSLSVVPHSLNALFSYNSLSGQEEMKEKAKVEEEKKDEEKEDPKGIPEFWLTVFKNVDLLSEMLQVGRGRMNTHYVKTDGSYSQNLVLMLVCAAT